MVTMASINAIIINGNGKAAAAAGVTSKCKIPQKMVVSMAIQCPNHHLINAQPISFNGNGNQSMAMAATTHAKACRK